MKTNIKIVKNSKTKNLLVNLIQASLKGRIKENVGFNPQFLADAIISKTEFDKPFNHEIYHKELINSIKVFIDSIKEDMKEQLELLRKDETLLKNFVNGQTTACDKFEDFINKL